MAAYKMFLAELIGVFGLTFIGAGVICIDPVTHGGIVAIALAHGIILMVMVYATGHISGGHINPAVTISLFITKNISAGRAVGYIVAQLLGAVIAGYLLKGIFPALPNGLGAPALASGVSVSQGILVEAVLTFFLVFAVFGTAVDSRCGNGVYGIAIGLTIAADILMGGALTGAAMNPARAFGPAFASGDMTNQLVYWVGPILGGAVAGLCYAGVLLKKD